MSTSASQKVALVIGHLDSPQLGTFELLLRGRGYEIRQVDTTELTGESEDADLVIALGGDTAIYDAAEHTFLADEVAFLARRLEKEQPTLGICLGAQLMAQALGGRVSKGKSVVIGFRELQLTEAGRDSPLRHIDGVPMMRWYVDSFHLPAGATRLASSAEYSNEAFRLGDYALAMQFHPELTGWMLEEWVAHGVGELAANGIDPDSLLAERDRFGANMERAGAAMLAEWLDTL